MSRPLSHCKSMTPNISTLRKLIEGNIKCSVKPYTLHFKKPSGTSRGVLTDLTGYFLVLTDERGRKGIGECRPLQGLSIDFVPELELLLTGVAKALETNMTLPLSETKFPAVVFALETALLDLINGGQRVLFPSTFSKGDASIPINGLVWMGTPREMREQMEEKIAAGFSCIKLKIGAIDFEEELSLLRDLRAAAPRVEIRVDANGAFSPQEAMKKLEQLAALNLHSIEQPIQPRQHSVMRALCKDSSVPVALDEDLIGVSTYNERARLLDKLSPKYIILKPALVGGFASSEEWIRLSDEREIGWWVTSALESNIGLNAIAQWAYTLGVKMPQGLGTGGLYTNNFSSPLFIERGELRIDAEAEWNLSALLKLNE